MRNVPPIGSCVWTLGSQRVLLLGKVMDPLRGGACLKELCHLKLALKLYSLPHFLSSFCFLCGDKVWSPIFLLPPPGCLPFITSSPLLKLPAKTNPFLLQKCETRNSVNSFKPFPPKWILFPFVSITWGESCSKDDGSTVSRHFRRCKRLWSFHDWDKLKRTGKTFY